MRPSLVIALVLTAVPMAALASGITVPIDQSRRLPFGGSAASIQVGNDAIAGVNVIDSHTIMVVGKRQGVTNVVVFDAAGRTIYDGEVIVSAASGSMVTVYRGAKADEYSCSPYCQSSAGESHPVVTMPMGPGVTTSTPVLPAPPPPSN